MKPVYLILFFIAVQKMTAQNILTIQQQRFDATTGRDSLSLTRLLSDDLFYIHSNGLAENKSQHIAAILSQKIVYQSFTYAIEPTIWKNKKLQIINGNVLVKGLYSGKSFEMNLLFTAVYQRNRKQWQLLRWQSTKV